MLSPAPALAQTATSADVAAAVAAPGRSDDAVKLDESRRPAKVLPFLGLKKGDAAADIMAGTGYYSELIARVVGPRGAVLAYEPKQFYDGQQKAVAAWDALKKREPNVTLETYPFDAFSAPAGSFDFVLLHMVYHDLYWQSDKFGIPKTDPARFLAALFRATKPGGIVGVVDHVADPNDDTRATVDRLHRIDPAVIRADFENAGFVLEAESDALRMPSDDHSKLVFDPSVRGKTDRIVYRFRKPA
ncbi:class I SAM-dependent methyltransferase [Stakelama marina]|uniref:class I SAM-dependent methyltransferase n=1 Tax=Stakelama marina TaxID=2826939 RepID=UPI0024C30516|nr:methyltransferase domain-containing protein [Stakelama marina]